jgi:Flp pilus assembly protein TadG
MRSADALDRGGRQNKMRGCRAKLSESVGGALIELALVLPVFAVLLAGAAEYAVLAYDAIEVSNAARAGVAYGSQSSTTASDLAGMQASAIADGPDVAGLGAVATEFWSCSNAPATQSTSPPTCTTGNHVLNYVEVTTSASVKPWMHIPGLPLTYNLSGLDIMRVQ